MPQSTTKAGNLKAARCALRVRRMGPRHHDEGPIHAPLHGPRGGRGPRHAHDLILKVILQHTLTLIRFRFCFCIRSRRRYG